MTGEEAIKRLKSDIYKYSDFTENPNENEFWTAFDMAIKALEAPHDDNWEGYSSRLWKAAYERGKAEAEPRWIPVSERLPEAGEYIGDVAKYYLVQNEYGDMLVARYTNGEYWEQIFQLKPIGDEIVAWMPLPEPMKEGD